MAIEATDHDWGGTVHASEEALDIVELLTQAYWMEIEIVTHYLAGSTPGGAGAVDAVLARGIDDEVEHTRALGRRILELHGDLPDQGPLQYGSPLGRQPDERAMLEALIAIELGAIRHYARIVRATAAADADTHELALSILEDERRHLRLFERFLRECRPAAVTA